MNAFQYHDLAGEVAQKIQTESFNLKIAIESFSVMISSAGRRLNVSYPFFSVPDFSIRASYINQLAHTTQVGLFPLVNQTTKSAYEEFSLDYSGWIQDTLNYQSEDWEWNETDYDLPSFIHHHKESNLAIEKADTRLIDVGPGDFAPVWQQAPVFFNTTINLDFFQYEDFRTVYRSLWESQLPALSGVSALRVHDDGSNTSPHSFLLHPLYPYLSKTGYPANDLVGVIMAVFKWVVIFENILPQGTFLVM
jgi:hypothetical protein